MGLHDLQSTTWKELRVKKGKKGWAGWIVKSDDGKLEFQEPTLCPGEVCHGVNNEGDAGLVALQERVEEAAGVEATTAAMVNMNKFMIPDEIREMVAAAAKCSDTVGRKMPRKNARKAQGGPSPETRGGEALGHWAGWRRLRRVEGRSSTTLSKMLRRFN